MESPDSNFRRIQFPQESPMGNLQIGSQGLARMLRGTLGKGKNELYIRAILPCRYILETPRHGGSDGGFTKSDDSASNLTLANATCLLYLCFDRVDQI